MITLSRTEGAATPPLPSTSAMRLIAVAASRWRVVDPDGRAIGHLDAAPTAEGTRFRARRYHAPSGGFRELGAFWSAADAVDCLRLSA